MPAPALAPLALLPLAAPTWPFQAHLTLAEVAELTRLRAHRGQLSRAGRGRLRQLACRRRAAAIGPDGMATIPYARASLR